MSKQKNNLFLYWLVFFLLVLLLQATSFLVSLYLLAEILRNGNRWIAFGVVVFVNLLLLLAISFLNEKMSEGFLGSAMQKIRISRFTAAFLMVMIASLLGALLVYFIDDVIYPSVALTPFGPIAVLLASLGAVLEFAFAYCLFQGQGISRL